MAKAPSAPAKAESEFPTATIGVSHLLKPGQEVAWRPQPRQNLFLQSPAFEGLYGGALGGGKQVRLDEPIPTPEGWSTVGGLRVGDAVFDERGQVCRVTHLHPIDNAPVSYRLAFDDGTAIEACADHQWLTFDKSERSAAFKRTPEYRAARRLKRASRASGRRSALFSAAMSARNAANPPATKEVPTGTVRTTAEIARSVRDWRGNVQYSIPVAGALNLPDATLPLDPYLMGVWLGDGHSSGGAITTADDEILQAFADAGFTTRHYSRYTHGVYGLVTILKPLGVVQNKHIPIDYLRASRDQRLALLQGLMDTDGTVAKHSGSAEFTTTSEALAHGTYELVVSLGWKVSLRPGVAKLNGREIGPKWTLKWVASDYVFRLPRKRNIQKLASSPVTRHRYIVSCEPCAPSPMRCLTVDSPSHLFLVGKSMVPTHNSQALLYGALRYIDFPTYRGLLLRASFPELQELMDEAQAVFPTTGGRWIASEKRCVWPSGAIVSFGYCATYAEVLQYRGKTYQYIGYDEIGDMAHERVWTFLLTRLRDGKDPRLVKMARCTANPGGVGEPWLMARFIDKCGKDGEIYVDPDTGNTRCFVQSFLADNPALTTNDPEYARRLLVLSNTEREQMLGGVWGLGSVKAFPSLTENSHVVPRSNVPDYAQCFGGFDWGFGHRWSFSVAYGRPGGKLRIVDSCGGRKQTPDVIVDRIRDLLTSRKLKISSLNYTVAGSDVKIRDEARGAYGPSVMEQFGVAGLWLLGADQSRIAGYQNLLRYIDHRLIEWEDTPGNHMVIATLRRMVTDPDNPNDVLKVDTNPLTGEGGDDDYDQTRYLAMSRPIASVEPVQTSAVEQRVKRYMQKKPERDPRAIRMPRTLSLNAGTRTLKVA